MKLQFDIGTATETETFDVVHCVVAGWTGRDEAAVRHHIDELRELGVSPPSTVPLYYRVASTLLTQDSRIEVLGGASSGEAEPLVVARDGELFLGLASDHTDRELESHSVALSKQLCPKPVAGELWPFAEVADHLESLELRSWIIGDAADEWVLYQEGSLAAIRPLTELIEGAHLLAAGGGSGAAVMLCGTMPALGGVRPARAFRMELHDPMRGRSLSHHYTLLNLPVVS